MRITIRVLLAWFAFFGLGSGLWQMFAPESFYTQFPGFGRHWVDVDGPYNEHLLRDVAQGNLAFGVVALVALLAFRQPGGQRPVTTPGVESSAKAAS